MATFIQLYQTVIVNGIATADSVLVTVAIYGPAETIDTNDGATLRIIDNNVTDGLISSAEFAAATGGGGLGLNGGSTALLWDGTSGGSNDGTLFSTDAFTSGTDLNATIDGLPSGFTPIDPNDIAICFTIGTLIRTSLGDRLIETLAAGDLIQTLDNGFQPIRWIGSTKRPAIGKLAPILFRKDGPLGNTRDLKVSPLHRMLLTGWQAELLFGQNEVLAPAKALINDNTIVRAEGGEVEYFHTGLCS